VRTLQTYYGSVGTTLGCSQVRPRAACCERQHAWTHASTTTLTSALPQPLLCAGVFYVRWTRQHEEHRIQAPRN
jgi:hypothetical protein